MSTLFGNLNNAGLEESQDRLGGGFQPRSTDIYDMEIVLDDSGPRLEDPVDDFLARLGVAPGARELAAAPKPEQARSGGSGCLGTALLVLTVALAILVATMV